LELDLEPGFKVGSSSETGTEPEPELELVQQMNEILL
jgi:hypothetical protein